MKKLVCCLLLVVLSPLSALAITVTLAWDRHPDPNVAGYNVYRATVSGGPYTKLNLMLLPQTPNPPGDTPQYVDDTIPAGSQLTYYYVVRAANTGGVESANSNEVSVNPPPTPPTNLRIITVTAINLQIDNKTVASGPPYPVVYNLPRQTPPRIVPIRVTVEP